MEPSRNGATDACRVVPGLPAATCPWGAGHAEGGSAGDEQGEAGQRRAGEQRLDVDLARLPAELGQEEGILHNLLPAVEIAPPARREAHSGAVVRLPEPEGAEPRRQEQHQARGAARLERPEEGERQDAEGEGDDADEPAVRAAARADVGDAGGGRDSAHAAMLSFRVRSRLRRRMTDPAQPPSTEAPRPAPPPRLWAVLGAYLLAFATIVLFSLLAGAIVRDLYPDQPARLVFVGLPGLIAGGLASSAGLALTVALVSRPLAPATLRLLPGRETGPALAAMVVGMLALGQALDSLTMLAGLGQQGTLVAIRRALEGAVGPELFLAVLVIGVLAGTAEEVFFRCYMQTRLAERLRPAAAVALTSAAFGLLHLEWLHALLAFLLGLYLGWITELSGSALPAIASHVINNALFTLLTALFGAVEGAGANTALLAASGLVFVGCIAWLRRTAPAL